MKALIVDDEKHVLEGVELAVDWQRHHIREVLTAQDGWEALQIVRREAPDVIICDMSMPRMDGVSFLEKLRQEGWSSQVIVLSGYQEFRYAKAALKAQGVDYLLKPFKINELNQAVGKAAESARKLKEQLGTDLERNYQLQEASMRMNEQKMAVCLQADQPNPELIRQLLTEAGFHAQRYDVVLFLPQNYGVMLDRYLGDELLLHFVVRNVLGEMLESLGPYYFFRLEPFYCLFLGGNVRREDVMRRLEKLKQAWRNAIKLITISGCSASKTDDSAIPKALTEARAEILNTPLQTGGDDGSRQEAGPKPVNLANMEIVILEAMKTWDKEHVGNLVRSLVRDIRKQPGLSLKDLQQYTIEANLLLMRVSQQLQQQHLVEPLSLWISDLAEWETALIHKFWLLMESGGNLHASPNTIHAIRHYIESHLHEDISLTLLSDLFHFSPQYITKKFRETYHTTVLSYLTQLRMDKAKSLLAHSQLPIGEIAQLVGYEDENYFGKVFRKHEGISPSQYRRQPR